MPEPKPKAQVPREAGPGRAGPWILGALLGLTAAWANTLSFSILTPETPEFIFGAALVFVAFLTLGFGPGLLAALIVFSEAIFSVWSFSHGAALGAGVYVLEAVWVWALYGRIRSLPLAVTMFWLTAGAAYDFTVYPLVAGLPVDYVIMLLVKQLLNGIVTGSIAELLLSSRVVGWVPESWRLPPTPMPVARYAFNRIVFLALLPVMVLGAALARSQYARALQEIVGENDHLASEIEARLSELLSARHGALAKMAGEIAAHPEDESTLVDELRASLVDAVLVAMVDSTGEVTSAAPAVGASGRPFVGLNVSGRDYFQRAKADRVTVYSDPFSAMLPLTENGSGMGVVVGEPVLDRGSFLGLALVGFDPRRLVGTPGLISGIEGGTVTIFDRDGNLIAAQDSSRAFGASVESVLRPANEQLDAAPVLRDRTEDQVVEFYGGVVQGDAARLGLDLNYGAYRAIGLSGWGVLVDRPASYVWARFRPIGLWIIAMFLVMVALILVVVQHFARQIADPYRRAADVARLITEGSTKQLAALAELANSNLTEVLDLSASLSRMEEGLVEKDLRTRQREQYLQAQLLQAQKMEAIGLLAGGVAHDFNNTLTPILGYADLGMEIIEDAEARDFFEQISEAASRAKEITFQLLAFGRKQTLEIRSISLTEEIRRSEKLLRPLLRENIALQFDLPEDPGWVLADEAQLHQILINLAVNAQDAMPSGGKLTIQVDRVERVIDPPDGEEAEPGPHIRLRITDTGEGIPEVILPHIFEPFFTTKVVGHGTGLGLSTVYGIVRQHGGIIQVENQPGAGTSFIISLPEVPQSDQEGTEVPVARPIIGSGRILLVEDDAAVRRLGESVISRGGYEVVAAESAEEALEIFRSEESAKDPHSEHGGFDLLVSDVVLPGMNGRELYDELESIRPDLPVIFVSGYSHDVLSKTGLPPRAHLLMKPFRRHEIIAKIHEVLGTEITGSG
jgi:signal transduction histidine kinase/ActR/RegA family two-component response regulator